MLWRRKSDATEENSLAKPADRVPESDTGELKIKPQAGPDRVRGAPRSPRAALQPERVVMPTRHSRRAHHPVVTAGSAVFTLLIIIALAIGGGWLVIKNRLAAPGPLQDDKTVNIAHAGVFDVADVLEREGVIDQRWPFIISVGLNRMRRNDVKAGEYQFTKQASLQDVINTLVDGKVIQHAITIPEGLTSEQIVQRLLDTDFLAGNIKSIPREGSLLPETYRFARGTPREQVIQRMQREQREVLQKAWERHSPDLPVRTPEQLIVLASIVEKETGRPEERSRVAAVFANRLKQKMRLQSDPTIIYGLVGGKGALGRPITKSEITQPTPYNTYTIDGLPPGPIANPGRASIEAAANPARTKELFFVADGTGGHAFAETLDQHSKNVAKLRALEAGESASAPDETAAPAETPQPPKPKVAKPAPPKPKPPAPQAQNQNPGAPQPPQPRPQ
ncbi:MAG: endolytic transglycosylase MltG [Xanthobacteraceae bacterium]|jgi:UPF0755 protein